MRIAGKFDTRMETKKLLLDELDDLDKIVPNSGTYEVQV
jgi:hypothetical protein